MNERHQLAPESLPRYLAGPDGVDPLFTATLWFGVLLALLGCVAYLKLHAIPERMAHGRRSTQLQLIAVLAVLALFTHNNLFWVAALLLSVVRLPDFSKPLASIASSLERMAPPDPSSPEEEPTGDDEAVPAAEEKP